MCLVGFIGKIRFSWSLISCTLSCFNESSIYTTKPSWQWLWTSVITTTNTDSFTCVLTTLVIGHYMKDYRETNNCSRFSVFYGDQKKSGGRFASLPPQPSPHWWTTKAVYTVLLSSSFQVTNEKHCMKGSCRTWRLVKGAICEIQIIRLYYIKKTQNTNLAMYITAPWHRK